MRRKNPALSCSTEESTLEDQGNNFTTRTSFDHCSETRLLISYVKICREPLSGGKPKQTKVIPPKTKCLKKIWLQIEQVWFKSDANFIGPLQKWKTQVRCWWYGWLNVWNFIEIRNSILCHHFQNGLFNFF